MDAVKTWSELTDDELCKEMELDDLRAELAAVTAERDALRARVEAVPVDAIRAYWGASEPSPRWYAMEKARADCASIQLWLHDQEAAK